MIFPINKAKYKITELIYGEAKIKISDLIKKTRVSQKFGYKYIEELLKTGIIYEELEGKKPLLRFLRPNFKTETGKLYFSLLEAEKTNKFFERSKKLVGPIKHFIDELQGFAETAVIFGSFARNAQNTNSDLDIAILTSKKSKRINAIVERCFVTLENHVSARIFDTENFFKSEDPLIKSIINDHIILFNFWNWMEGYKYLYK